MSLQPALTQTKGEVAYTRLRDAVRTGVLQPGQRVTLVDLSEQLGMSLTPVREALRMMATQGLVEQESNKFTTIAQYTLESGLEVYRLRLLLEPLAVQLAVPVATKEQLANLRAIQGRARAALPSGHSGVLAELNYEFHMALCQISNQPLLMQFIERLWNGVPFQAMSLAGRNETSLDEHDEIVNAIEDGDLKAAELIRNHIGHAASATLLTLPTSRNTDEVRAEIEALVHPIKY
ncbi:GntR family transcriptional regulator [Rhodococcus erythropolis]|uniref:GntR family transcriptional regulator n=1 Tax=Rhodococcus erythropolis TaxID=1833 RepID=UPI0024B6D8AB|nr:GntR family transcriptional regulator [Rhodococcus erythropolis]MDJ0015998.1 GntR family transcriptional regulator [Rhodococcus erythropolis]MDJ0107919.1 GntR family transcriptional regulator [Rhodococcus erythropolis]